MLRQWWYTLGLAGMNTLNQLKARLGQTAPPPIAIMNFTTDLCGSQNHLYVDLTQEHKVVWHNTTQQECSIHQVTNQDSEILQLGKWKH